MRGADFIPLALVGALAGVVGAAFLREPHSVRPQPVLGPDPATITTIAVDIVDSVPVRPEPTTRMANAPAAGLPFGSDPINEEIDRRMRYGAAGTYILEANEGRNFIARWPERPTEPIRIWVQPASTLPNWTRAHPVAARDGIKRWSDAGIPVRLAFVVDSSDAEVTVLWVDTLPYRIGQAQRSLNRKYLYVRAVISVALRNSNDLEPLSLEAVRVVAAHEAGHMLGLDHSPFPDDVMFAGYSRQVDPSGRDLQTMRLLYTLPPGRFR